MKFKKILAAFAAAAMALTAVGVTALADTTTYTADELSSFKDGWTLTDATATVDTANSRIQFASTSSSSDSTKGIAIYALTSGSAYEISFTYKMNSNCKFGFISNDGTTSTRSTWDNGATTRSVTITVDANGNGTYTDYKDSDSDGTYETTVGTVTASNVVGLYIYADTTSRKVSINAPIVITETAAETATDEPTATAAPISGAYDNENSEYVWTFGDTATGTATYEYAAITVGIGSWDSLIDNSTATSSCGIYFSDSSVKETNSSDQNNVSQTNRYIMVTPAVSGTITFTISFSDKTNNRIYYAAYENGETIDFSVLQKGQTSDSSKTISKIGDDIGTSSVERSLDLTAGTTYVFYTYQKSSYITSMTYTLTSTPVITATYATAKNTLTKTDLEALGLAGVDGASTEALPDSIPVTTYNIVVENYTESLGTPTLTVDGEPLTATVSTTDIKNYYIGTDNKAYFTYQVYGATDYATKVTLGGIEGTVSETGSSEL